MTTYSLGAVKPFVSDAAHVIGPKFGLATIYGWRATSVDMTGHPAGLALDLVVGDNKAKGDQVASYLIANHDALHIKYLCWQQQQWTPAKGWVPMAYRPGATAGYDPNHRHHVHASFLSAGSSDRLAGAPDGGGSGGGKGAAGSSIGGDIAGAIGDLNPLDNVKTLFERETWIRVGYVLGGAQLIIVGLALIVLAMADTGPGKAVLSAVPQTRAVGAALSIKGAKP
jgi:hypothetical protein